LVVTGIIQVVNLLSINAKKDIDDLRDRTASIRIEVQHKFGKATTFSDLTAEQVGDFLIKLSNVFFTDINCFDTTGLLVSTSRPGLFNSGIMTERINPAAFTKLISEKSSVLVQQEIVGEMTYYSAYMPLYNDQNDLFGYVNLPYFSKQDESKRDIASFMVTFLNIYILLMLIGIVITIMISDYFTASLVLLTGKLSRLRLDKRNEKIDWKTDDEIGKLVSEYNRMVDELENSAKLLAQSERESAWREMARQVAHEIKNPLTPLKLSAQHLQKAWNEKSPGIDQRINRFLSTLVAQIDALSEIATDFSDFAKMPQMELMRVDVEDVLQFVLSMYPESTAIHYKLLTDGVPRHANADKAQLTRVFTNLINNAVQSFAEDQKGQIIIELSGDNHHVCVSVSDNGSGVPGNKAQEIFKPGFTTKTTGMGLGLAIVKTILNDLGGEISYHPNNDKGSVFTVKIPVWKTARE
jgi:nitrogen fixation/metabolism regulation signal transduction histidine kinase